MTNKQLMGLTVKKRVDWAGGGGLADVLVGDARGVVEGRGGGSRCGRGRMERWVEAEKIL